MAWRGEVSGTIRVQLPARCEAITILWEPSRDWLKSKFTWAYPQTETEKFQNNTSLRPSLFKPSLFLLFCNFAVFCLGVCPRKFAFQSVMRRLSKCGEVHTGSWTLVAAAGHSITPHFSIYGLQITGYNTNANVKAAAAARERKDCGAVAWHSPASNSQFSTYFPPLHVEPHNLSGVVLGQCWLQIVMHQFFSAFSRHKNRFIIMSWFSSLVGNQFFPNESWLTIRNIW